MGERHPLYVWNLRPGVPEATLLEAFGPCGGILGFQFRTLAGTSQLYVQIDFATQEGVSEGIKLSGRPIAGVPCLCGVVDPAELNRPAPPGSVRPPLQGTFGPPISKPGVVAPPPPPPSTVPSWGTTPVPPPGGVQKDGAPQAVGNQGATAPAQQQKANPQPVQVRQGNAINPLALASALEPQRQKTVHLGGVPQDLCEADLVTLLGQAFGLVEACRVDVDRSGQ